MPAPPPASVAPLSLHDALPISRRSGWLLRAAHPVIHAAGEGTGPHRHSRGSQGPAERVEEPVCPPARPRHLVRVHRAVDDVVGPRSEEHTSELQSLTNLVCLLLRPPPSHRFPYTTLFRSHAGAGGYFAPHIRSYMRRAKAPDHIGILVALKDRQNALKNPYAHLHDHDISFESIEQSMMLWDPDRKSTRLNSSH